jgi:hypothetical protein
VFGFVSVIVKTAAEFCAIVAGLNVFVADDPAKTVSVSSSPLSVPALEDVMVDVLFVYVPAAVAVTGTTMVQPAVGMVAPEMANEAPLLAMVTVPPQVFVAGDAAVFFMLAG